MEIETVRVVSPKSEDNDQGFIIINKSDLTEDHELFDPAPKKVGIADLRAALTAKGIEFDPEANKATLQALLDESNQA